MNLIALPHILTLQWKYTCNSVIKSRKLIKGFVELFFRGKPSGDFRVIILMIKTMYKTSLTFTSGSLVGVGRKVQFVVYFALFVMMSTNIEKTSAVSAVSEGGHA